MKAAEHLLLVVTLFLSGNAWAADGFDDEPENSSSIEAGFMSAAAFGDSVQQPCVKCDSKSCCCPQHAIYGEAEVLFITRNITMDDQTVVIQLPSEDVVLRTGDLDFDFEPGYRFLLGYEINECTNIEVSYLSLEDLKAQAVRTGNNNLAIPGALGANSLDFNGADRMQVNYDTRLHSLEANLVREYCRMDLLFGFRYVDLDESFNIHPNDPDTGESDYNIRSGNDMYGAQLGVIFDRQPECRRWGWDVVAKAGLYYNDASQTQYVTDFPPGFYLRDLLNQAPISASDSGLAFLGELGLSGTFDLTSNLTLRGGYMLMWIDGVALAPSQLDFTYTPTSGAFSNDSGSIFLHGATLGLEGCF